MPSDVFADEAHESFLAFIVDVGKLAEVSGDEGQFVIGVDGKRDRDLAGGDHIDRTLVLVEDVEDRLEIAVRHEHAAGDDIDNTELLFDRDRLEAQRR